MEACLNIFKHALAVWYCATIYGSDVYVCIQTPSYHYVLAGKQNYSNL